jgi:hypothetical protein
MSLGLPLSEQTQNGAYIVTESWTAKPFDLNFILIKGLAVESYERAISLSVFFKRMIKK